MEKDSLGGIFTAKLQNISENSKVYTPKKNRGERIFLKKIIHGSVTIGPRRDF